MSDRELTAAQRAAAIDPDDEGARHRADRQALRAGIVLRFRIRLATKFATGIPIEFETSRHEFRDKVLNSANRAVNEHPYNMLRVRGFDYFLELNVSDGKNWWSVFRFDSSEKVVIPQGRTDDDLWQRALTVREIQR